MLSTQERIEIILPRLNVIARKLCWRSVEHEAADLVNEAVIAILELAGKHGGLDRFTDAYLCQCGFFRLQHAARDSRTYQGHVESERIFEYEDGDQESEFSWIASVTVSVEEEVSNRSDLNQLSAACRRMSHGYQEILSLLLEGYRPVEIAGRLGVSRSRISQRIGEIRECVRI